MTKLHLPKQLLGTPGLDRGPNPERDRLVDEIQRVSNWKRWGPYLSERQWGTVREDYSQDGSCWTYFSHDQSRSRAYRWGEDGLLGICDRQCRLCFALALWNGKDPILKERLFGLTGPEGNHGEDVKERYFYLESTPTHSIMRAAYHYPQSEFPYERLVTENRSRGRTKPEFELEDTGAFAEDRYFHVEVAYAKESADHVLIEIAITNRGPEAADLHVLPHLWFRNTWSWGAAYEGKWGKPSIRCLDSGSVSSGAALEFATKHADLADMHLVFEASSGGAVPVPLFTENHTNTARVWGKPNSSPAVKDAFHDRVVHNRTDGLASELVGTKAAAWYKLRLAPGQTQTIRARLVAADERPKAPFGASFTKTFAERASDAERFYSLGRLGPLSACEHVIARQAYAGLLWSKQFYQYVVEDWLEGDPLQPLPPASRQARSARNTDWRHLFARDVILMPDKWEYPWFAAWDLAFHCVAVSHVDPQLAKDQLLLVMREWYMHPSGAIPAYEFAFGDVNPPVHAWACWRVYKITGRKGERDRVFLARAFHKLLLNFTWWINRKDPEGRNLFGGGFLGLDNIGVFDRSANLGGARLEQADGTAWMAFFCGTMLSIALELAKEDPAYEDVASKFFEHFIAIIDAMNPRPSRQLGNGGVIQEASGGLWDDHDGFYYDQMLLDGSSTGRTLPLRVRSMVGLIPLMACEVIEESTLEKLPGFRKRMNWFLENRRDLAGYVSFLTSDEGHEHALLAIPSRERLLRVLKRALDPNEFLSPYGIRSLSKYHEAHPFVFVSDGASGGSREHRVSYLPGESDSGMFGGNSNWRGPIWMPLNYLFIEALERYHHFYGPALTVEYPIGSGQTCTLGEVAMDLRRRLATLFLPKSQGSCPSQQAQWANFERTGRATDAPPLLFHEYFHAETGAGLGASHQTGWTALIAPLLKDLSRSRNDPSASRAPEA